MIYLYQSRLKLQLRLVDTPVQADSHVPQSAAVNVIDYVRRR